MKLRLSGAILRLEKDNLRLSCATLRLKNLTLRLNTFNQGLSCVTLRLKKLKKQLSCVTLRLGGVNLRLVLFDEPQSDAKWFVITPAESLFASKLRLVPDNSPQSPASEPQSGANQS